ncbi:MAG: exodeoxyribonuclease VII large subunit [Bacteroidia bacterium]
MPNHQFSSISALTLHIQSLLKRDVQLQNVEVKGEISNFTKHGSGNLYFSLKDKDSQMKCMMQAKYANYLTISLKEGDKVEVSGDVDVYVLGGYYQLKIHQLRKSGLGDLYQQFVELKEKLEKEGLFEAKYKKKIPKIPRHIALITSPTGAALQDMLTTIQQRFPHVSLTLLPTTVQGEQGVFSIIQSLKNAQLLENKPDVIILGRGGGSIEDLWNFNEESVARAIFACTIPIIAGIGHESDDTIADFVADFRAATPTAAAQKAVPEVVTVKNWLKDKEKNLLLQAESLIANKSQLLDDFFNRLESSTKLKIQATRHELSQASFSLQRNLISYVPAQRMQLANYQNQMTKVLQKQLDQHTFDLEQTLYQLKQNLTNTFQQKKQTLLQQSQFLQTTLLQSLTHQKHELNLLHQKLRSMDITALLKQGYTLTLKNGKVVHSSDSLETGDTIETLFETGSVKSIITEKKEKK